LDKYAYWNLVWNYFKVSLQYFDKKCLFIAISYYLFSAILCVNKAFDWWMMYVFGKKYFCGLKPYKFFFRWIIYSWNHLFQSKGEKGRDGRCQFHQNFTHAAFCIFVRVCCSYIFIRIHFWQKGKLVNKIKRPTQCLNLKWYSLNIIKAFIFLHYLGIMVRNVGKSLLKTTKKYFNIFRFYSICKM